MDRRKFITTTGLALPLAGVLPASALKRSIGHVTNTCYISFNNEQLC